MSKTWSKRRVKRPESNDALGSLAICWLITPLTQTVNSANPSSVAAAAVSAPAATASRMTSRMRSTCASTGAKLSGVGSKPGTGRQNINCAMTGCSTLQRADAAVPARSRSIGSEIPATASVMNAFSSSLPRRNSSS